LSGAVALAVLLLATPAQADEQTRVYGRDGRVLGTITTDSSGTSSTTSDGTTVFYGADGRPQARTTSPGRNPATGKHRSMSR
jgi:hypothetical protein